MPETSSFTKFIRALNVTNAALEAHRDSITFMPMLVACASMPGDQKLGVEIHRTDPDAPHDYYTIRLREGTFVLVARDAQDVAIAWRVDEEYLDEVASHPTRYLEDPSLLDFDWLRERTGLSI